MALGSVRLLAGRAAFLAGAFLRAYRLRCGLARARTRRKAVRTVAYRSRGRFNAGLFATRKHADDDVVRVPLVDARDLCVREDRAPCGRPLVDRARAVGGVRRIRQVFDRTTRHRLVNWVVGDARAKDVVDALAWRFDSDCARAAAAQPVVAGRSMAGRSSKYCKATPHIAHPSKAESRSNITTSRRTRSRSRSSSCSIRRRLRSRSGCSVRSRRSE